MRKPNHIAFIMDGNNRWSISHGFHFSEGHRRGLEVVENILDHCFQNNIPIVTLYAFSSENWKRSEEEKKILFDLLLHYFNNKIHKVLERETRIRIIGDTQRFPEDVKHALAKSEKDSRGLNKHVLQVALGYGGRDEIHRAVKAIAQKVVQGKIDPETIDEEMFQSHLDTSGIEDPDLLIRTSGEYRISNFLLYQSAYTEFYFTPTLWPDFTVEELDRAIVEYGNRERRYGGRIHKILK